MANTQAATRKQNGRQQAADLRELDPAEVGRDIVQYLRDYARENPESAALWCFGIGFVLGWKLKLW
jgi:hypothetical protein